MSFKTGIEIRGDIIWFDVVGDVTPENILALARAIREECDKASLNGAIVDCIGMEGALSAGNIFFTTQEFVRIIGGHIRVAYINPSPDWIPADDQFSRNVAHNNGGSLELFESVDEAISWLEAKPSP